MWPAIASFLLGVIGWLLVSFFGKPFLDFLKLRSQVHEELIFTANIDQMSEGTPRYEEAGITLRRLGCKMLAAERASTRLLRWYLSKRGYELVFAGTNLVGLANSLNKEDRHLHIDRIEKGLRFPSSYIPEYLEMIKREISHPRS